jgi:hypothetical protein
MLPSCPHCILLLPVVRDRSLIRVGTFPHLHEEVLYIKSPLLKCPNSSCLIIYNSFITVPYIFRTRSHIPSVHRIPNIVVRASPPRAQTSQPSSALPLHPKTTHPFPPSFTYPAKHKHKPKTRAESHTPLKLPPPQPRIPCSKQLRVRIRGPGGDGSLYVERGRSYKHLRRRRGV